jgi:biotin carboxyl carrier protein
MTMTRGHTAQHLEPKTKPATVVELELSEPIRVISARLWAVVLGLTVALAIAGTWVYAGSWPRHLIATAIVQHGAGPVDARSASTGSVAAVDVRVGQRVAAGQTVAVIAGPRDRSAISAPTDGVVVAIPADVGSEVVVGSAVVVLDEANAAASAYLVVRKPSDVTLLEPNQRVSLSVAGQTVTGRVQNAPATPTTGARLTTDLAIPTYDLPRDQTPLWLVAVTLDPGQQIGFLSQATAVVTLPSTKIWRLITGNES